MDELRAALTALGRSLLDTDIEVFRLGIETLDTLNAKWKLYHKVCVQIVYLKFIVFIIRLFIHVPISSSYV